MSGRGLRTTDQPWFTHPERARRWATLMDMTADTRIAAPGDDEADSGYRATARRWFGAGSARSLPAHEAGAQATRQALRGADPALLVVFCSEHLDPAGVPAGVRDVAGEQRSEELRVGKEGRSRWWA